jgi:hypothetical protein
MSAARAKFKAVADLNTADIEAPIVYAKVFDGAEATDSKKKGSRWNALRHGCMAKVLFPPELEAEIEQCTAVLTEHYQPTTAYEVGLIKNLGRLAAQIERLQVMKVIDLQRTMDRAVVCWDEDREIYIDKLSERLMIDPLGVSRALSRSKQGIAWLLENWGGLISILETQGSWTEGQCRLAMDLLGIPVDLRAGNPMITPESDAATLDAVIATEMDRLDERLHRYIYASDNAEREMTAAGMPKEEDAQTKRLRKDDSRLRLEYRRCKAELLESRAQAQAAAAAAAAAAGPAPAPGPSAADPAPPPAAAAGAASWTCTDISPKPRPTTSTAAFNFLQKRSMLEGFEIQATATSPAEVVNIWLPFPGGDAAADSRIEPERECEPEAECKAEAAAASVVDLDPVPPQTACGASNVARKVVVNKQLDRVRRQHRAQQKKARKAARRRR